MPMHQSLLEFSDINDEKGLKTLWIYHCMHIINKSTFVLTFITDIAISFSQPLYLVNENSGSAKPELVLNKTDCSTLSVWVNVKEITAKGKYI